jgi:predicted aspartyl protease
MNTWALSAARVTTTTALLMAACAAASPTQTPTSTTAPTSPPTTLAAAPTPTSSSSSTAPPMSTLGSDVSSLPRLYPNGEWLPIEAPLLSMQLIVKVEVNGNQTLAILDTGAMGTTISEPMAQKLGMLSADTPRGMPVRAVDAHGDVIFGEKVRMTTLGLGARVFQNTNVTVLGNSPDLFLIGADVLAAVDLYIAADEGLVGIFEAGTAPRRSADIVVPVDASNRQLVVAGAADGPQGKTAKFEFLVDTGAWNSSVPTVTGINAGLAADLAYSAITVGVAGEQEARGRFIISPLRLGAREVPVGRVLAVSSTIDGGEGFGLLGNDVLMRFHTIISFRNAELRFRKTEPRPTTRMTGPGGVRCNGPCVSVRLAPSTREPAADDWPGVCLQVDIDAAYARQTVELAITAEDDSAISLFNGGAIRAYVSVDADGAHHCFPLWPQLERLGLRKESTLSLRWVRTEGLRWPCDPMKTRCISFTGPLAKLAVR